MVVESMQAAPWQLDGYQARLALGGGLSGNVDLLQPAAGLQFHWQNRIHIVALGVELPPVKPSEAGALIDAWVRGGDLVATYSQGEKRRGQIYWRVQSCDDAAAASVPTLELIASVQTSLLDSDPALGVRSLVAAQEVLRLTDDPNGRLDVIHFDEGGATSVAASSTPACFVFRLGEMSYLEMVHPVDFTGSSLQRLPDGQIELSHRLFRGRLEKGVILRSRLRGLFVPREQDAALARRCYASFAASEPPLTT
jgi:hypothetical protein